MLIYTSAGGDRKGTLLVASTPTLSQSAVPRSKVRAPRVRHAEVSRDDLLSRVSQSDREVVAVCAPPGYGKSTFAIQWAGRAPRPVVWLTVDTADNDPLVLMAGFAAAVHTAFPASRLETVPLSDEPFYSRIVRPGFIAFVSGLEAPLTLVVDDAHLLDSPESVALLRDAIEALPAGSQTALVGRDLHRLPVPLWRGQGRVFDVRAEDLAFSEEETSAAVRDFGPDRDALSIHHAAKGWPVAVFLLSQASESRQLTDLEEFLDAEVLGTMEDELRGFVLDTAPLGAVDADLAAAVAHTRRAGHFLAEAITTVLMQPTGDGWFRYHPLLEEHVTEHLQREDPQRLRRVRTSAARWHLEQGLPDTAVVLAIASGDEDCMGTTVWAAGRASLLGGRASTVQRWLESIDPVVVNRVPALSLTAAWTNVTRGEYASALRHGKRLLEIMPPGWDRDLRRLPFAPHVALLQAVTWQGTNGPVEALRLVQAAREVIDTEDPVYSLVTLMIGVHLTLLGDPQAEAELEEAVALSASFGIPSTHVESLSVLGLHRIASGEQSAGCDAIEQARALYAFHDLTEMATSSSVMELGRVALASLRGRDADVLQAMAVQAVVCGKVEQILPWYRPLTGAVLADVSARMGDPAGYHEYLRWCVSADMPATGLCHRWRMRAQQEYARMTPLSDLTPAELRVWELLKTRMTLTEIGRALFLSRETVKSHTGSIYRKLGVASRREAQELAEAWQ